MANRNSERLYRIWKNMRTRCNNPRNVLYKHYGARGIKICKRWDDYLNFKQDMIKTYKDNLTLERIDNNGNYEPDNCRWATMLEQANNKRNNNMITFKGITKSISQWAPFIGIKKSTLYQRYYVYKWSIERCLTEGGCRFGSI